MAKERIIDANLQITGTMFSSNLVTVVESGSTDTEYPSAKAVYTITKDKSTVSVQTGGEVALWGQSNSWGGGTYWVG